MTWNDVKKGDICIYKYTNTQEDAIDLVVCYVLEADDEITFKEIDNSTGDCSTQTYSITLQDLLNQVRTNEIFELLDIKCNINLKQEYPEEFI